MHFSIYPTRGSCCVVKAEESLSKIQIKTLPTKKDFTLSSAFFSTFFKIIISIHSHRSFSQHALGKITPRIGFHPRPRPRYPATDFLFIGTLESLIHLTCRTVGWREHANIRENRITEEFLFRRGTASTNIDNTSVYANFYSLTTNHIP